MSKDYLKDLINKVKEQKKSEDEKKKKSKKKPVKEEIPAEVPEEVEEGIEELPESLAEEKIAVSAEKIEIPEKGEEEEPVSEAELAKQKGFESKLEDELKVLGRKSSSRIERGSKAKIPKKSDNEPGRGAEDPLKVMKEAVQEEEAHGKSTAEKEIENVLYDIEDVSEAAVIGIADEILGQAVKAFVVLKKDSDLS